MTTNTDCQVSRTLIKVTLFLIGMKFEKIKRHKKDNYNLEIDNGRRKIGVKLDLVEIAFIANADCQVEIRMDILTKLNTIRRPHQNFFLIHFFSQEGDPKWGNFCVSL